MVVNEFSSFTAARRKFYDDLQRWGPLAKPTSPLALADAFAYCRDLATQHYENFTVASYLLPHALRQDFCNVYAYCRWADDLGDELDSTEAAMTGLRWWQEELDRCFLGQATHPVMIALRATIEKHQLPKPPFDDLISAFQQDQSKTRYADDDELLDYCRRSANPVGRILLAMAHLDQDNCRHWSDAVCTGLQIANFCQDMARDAKLPRIYLPQSRWGAHRLSEEQILAAKVSPELQATLREWCEHARHFLLAGLPLSKQGPRWLRRNVLLFIGGGLSILQSIRQADHDVWSKRIEVRRATKMGLLAYASCGRLPRRLLHPPDGMLQGPNALIAKGTTRRTDRQHASVRDGSPAATSSIPQASSTVLLSNAYVTTTPFSSEECKASYTYCHQVAKSSRSNFYRSFHLLSPVKRQAMFAYYAFARLVDDDADAAGAARGSLGEWRQWMGELEGLCLGKTPGRSLTTLGATPRDKIMPALVDALIRFQIPMQPLWDLIDGVELDLQPSLQLETRAEMEQYCHQVATSVGNACLHIWQADTVASLSAARACGLAFQTTNILRDVAEDAARKRIYLPGEDLRAFGISSDRWLQGSPDGDWQGLIRKYSQQAQDWYREAWPLMDYLPRDGQRMFSLMWRSYYRLLERTMAATDQLWSTRVRLSRAEKIRLALQHSFSPWYCSMGLPSLLSAPHQPSPPTSWQKTGNA